MGMYRGFLIAAAGGLLAVDATAGMLTLGSDASAGNPLQAAPGVVSGPVMLTVTNDVSPDDPVEYFAGWQVRLIVTPDTGAAGHVEISSAALPADYVLSGSVTSGSANDSLSTVTTANDMLDAFDIAFDSGAQVPTTPANMLHIDFLPSVDASGTFGIFVVAGLGVTQWTNAGSDTAESIDHQFVNVPFNSGMHRIGEVQIIVPEPAVLAVCAMGAMGLIVRRQPRRHTRAAITN